MLPEQQTIEQASENNYPEGDVWNNEEVLVRRLAFINGAKHQSERMYNEEEVKHIVSEALESALVTVDLEQWFEQFKKK